MSDPSGELEIPLFVNKASNTPLYLQIKEQIKYMIVTGRLRPGSKLPSGRQLSDFLHINRATINNALAELEKEGYLQTEKGVGTFIVEHPSLMVERDHEKFKRIIKDSMAEANLLGFTKEEFVTASFVLAEYERTSQEADDGFYAVFVECNEPVLMGYKHDVEESVKIKVEPILIDKLTNMDSTTAQLVQGSGMVITTFTHLHEVRSLLKDMDVEIIGISAGPYLELLFKLSEVKPNSRMAVIMVNNRGAIEIAQSIKDSGIKHTSLIVTSFENREKMEEAIRESEVIVASNAIAEEVAKFISGDKVLMTYFNTLDPASKSMLKKVVVEIKDRLK